MPTIDEALVDSYAPNSKAISNGRALALKKKVAVINRDANEIIYFGEVQGSGKNPYRPSADFADPTKPVFRCSCPSRQIPCKHTLGLLYAIAGGSIPVEAAVPDDLAEKRNKAEKRAATKAAKATSSKPKQVNKAALTKKLTAQLAGLGLLEQLVHDLTRQGLGALTARGVQLIDEQAKQLGDAYLPGAQQALRELLAAVYDHDSRELRVGSDQDAQYSKAIDQLARLQALVQKGRDYLEARRADPDLQPDVSTGIAAQLGHAWQLTELAEAGCIDRGVELVQLAFNSYDDPSRQEFVDEGLWCHLGNGAIQRTLTYRPYKATKYIKEDDSVFHVLSVPELAVYPGEMNRRVRWDGAAPRPVTAADRATIRGHAHSRLAGLVKAVRAQLKAPLADKQPAALVAFARIGRVGDSLVLEDADGDRLELVDCAAHTPPTVDLVAHLTATAHRDQVILLRFDHDLDTRRLRAQPLTIITADAIIRLGY